MKRTDPNVAISHLHAALVEAVRRRVAWHRQPVAVAEQAAARLLDDIRAGRIEWLPPREVPPPKQKCQ